MNEAQFLIALQRTREGKSSLVYLDYAISAARAHLESTGEKPSEYYAADLEYCALMNDWYLREIPVSKERLLSLSKMGHIQSIFSCARNISLWKLQEDDVALLKGQMLAIYECDEKDLSQEAASIIATSDELWYAMDRYEQDDLVMDIVHNPKGFYIGNWHFNKFHFANEKLRVLVEHLKEIAAKPRENTSAPSELFALTEDFHIFLRNPDEETAEPSVLTFILKGDEIHTLALDENGRVELQKIINGITDILQLPISKSQSRFVQQLTHKK